jgi:hypothetical protein
MALRWLRTIDGFPHMFASRDHAATDWLLYCGGWQVGRVLDELRPAGAQRVVFCWSLTGPHTPEAPLAKRGEAATVAGAKQQLVDAMRAWAIWAGVRQSDGGGPVEPRWTEGDDEWQLISGEFVAGRIYRPVVLGPVQDLQWQLLTSGPMQGPGRLIGRAASIDAAKDRC